MVRTAVIFVKSTFSSSSKLFLENFQLFPLIFEVLLLLLKPLFQLLNLRLLLINQGSLRSLIISQVSHLFLEVFQLDLLLTLAVPFRLRSLIRYYLRTQHTLIYVGLCRGLWIYLL